MPLMNIVVKRKFYQSLPKLSANLAKQKFTKGGIYIFIAEVC
jgi:hypothetical protein